MRLSWSFKDTGWSAATDRRAGHYELSPAQAMVLEREVNRSALQQKKRTLLCEVAWDLRSGLEPDTNVALVWGPAMHVKCGRSSHLPRFQVLVSPVVFWATSVALHVRHANEPVNCTQDGGQLAATWGDGTFECSQASVSMYECKTNSNCA